MSHFFLFGVGGFSGNFRGKLRKSYAREAKVTAAKFASNFLEEATATCCDDIHGILSTQPPAVTISTEHYQHSHLL